MRQAESSLLKLRAVQKATGKLSGETAVGGKHQSEMKRELERLGDEVKTLRAENASLQRSRGAGVSAAGGALGTLVRHGAPHSRVRGPPQALEDKSSEARK